MTIRPAAAADIPSLARIAAAGYRAAFLPIIGEATLAQRDAAHFERRFCEQWPHLRLLQGPDGSVLGFNEVREGKLDMLFLRPDLTGRGLGAKLLADAEARDARRLDCFCANAGARRFYERHGWRWVGDFRQELAGRLFDSAAYEKPPG